ncbi:MAG: hypothetical protein HY069_05190 [Chlamydiia bacterium]|nr:hypothetical protein [Chlamydiia bacterium]
MVNNSLIHYLFLEAPLEGLLRWQKVCPVPKPLKPPVFESGPLSLKTKVIYIITGLFLILPIIGTILWIFMQTFGNPDRLARPLNEELADAPLTPSH